MALEVIGATTSIIGQTASLTDVGSKLLGGVAGLSLPAGNALSNYASYDYVISLHPLTVKDFNYPDTSYKAGKVLPIICKTAGADPNNRIKTSYGATEFYLDNFTINTVLGLDNPKTTGVSTLSFECFEPYSIGMFFLALQTAAYQAGFKNWRVAPFLLSIEFRGSKENGMPINIPFSARHIPIHFTTVKMKSTERGTRYTIGAYATQGKALTTQYASLKTETAIKGKTVQEILQTGEQSLQAVVNKKLKELVEKTKSQKVADEVVIIFPKDTAMPSSTSSTVASSVGGKGTSATVTTSTASSASSSDVYKKIGVSQAKLAQTPAEVNEIGESSMGFNYVRRGDTSTAKEADVWVDDEGYWGRGNMVVDPFEGTLKFSQETDIPTVINQVLLASAYPEKALADSGIDEEGFRTWWRIDTQVYYIDTDENLKSTADLPRILVYRVVPYKGHISKVTAPYTKGKGLDLVRNKIIKRYDYIYTGKNSEVIKFDIDFSVNFANQLMADGGKYSTDVALAGKTTADKEKPKETSGPAEGSDASKKAGANSSGLKSDGTGTSSDAVQGGGGADGEAQRAARVWHDALTNPNDMVSLNLEIWGDPYWIAHSGQGNYTAKPHPGVKDLNKDGSVNWQTSEVDVLVNFRSPMDINQTTGMYDFKSANHMDMSLNPKSGPVMGFTGLYTVNRVTNYFKGGQFRQLLKGYRRSNQELEAIAKANQTVGANNPEKGAK